MRISDRNKIADGITIHTTKRITTSSLWKVATIPELIAVHIYDGISRMHQRKRVPQVVERSRSEFVMTSNK